MLHRLARSRLERADAGHAPVLGVEQAAGDGAVDGLLVEVEAIGVVCEDGRSGLPLPDQGADGRVERARFILGDIRALPGADEQGAVVLVGWGGGGRRACTGRLGVPLLAELPPVSRAAEAVFVLHAIRFGLAN